MRDLTFICAYFLNSGMLVEQQTVWRAYAPDLKAHFHTIVTDDLSPEKPAREVFESAGLASQRLYRALQHRRWDWLFCRNLGVAKAKTDWVLVTDIDHVMPERTLRKILTTNLDPECVYRFSRVDAPHPAPWQGADFILPPPGVEADVARRVVDGVCDICAARTEQYIADGSVHGPLDAYRGGHVLTPYKPHPNSWMLTREMFERIGGYDERFSGYYGSDSEFRERVQRTARAVVMRPEPLVRYPREVIPDASTTTYQRKAKEDGLNVPAIKAHREKEEGWRPLRLTVPWKLEAQC